MFYSVTGKVILTEAGTVVLETGGIGYRLTVSGRTLGYAAEHSKEDAVRLFTHLSVREDALELFGFCDQSELSVFRQLISVSGVGPKAAISILTQLSPQEFVLAVMSSDYKALSRAQGIGKRIAERVILELKDKISKEAIPAQTADDKAVGFPLCLPILTNFQMRRVLSPFSVTAEARSPEYCEVLIRRRFLLRILSRKLSKSL